MLYDLDATRELFLVFQENCNYRGSWMFKHGFKHVFALERQALGWICIDPSRDDFHSYILPAGFSDDIIATFASQNPNCTVMQLFVQPVKNKTLTYPSFGLISCVTIMQYSLGVAWPLIVTPYQLYCRLASKRIHHIKVGKVWAAKAQSEQQTKQPRHQEQRQQTTETKPHFYKDEQKNRQRKPNES